MFLINVRSPCLEFVWGVGLEVVIEVTLPKGTESFESTLESVLQLSSDFLLLIDFENVDDFGVLGGSGTGQILDAISNLW